MIDINVPITNPELVAAIETIQNVSTNDTQNAYFKALKNARFLSPVTITPRPEPGGAEGKVTLNAGTKISFLGFTDINGETYLPVYTDWPALKKWRDIPDEQTIITSFDDISGMVMRDSNYIGFVVNPYSHSSLVTRDIINCINAGPVNEWTVEEDTPVLLGTPADYPFALKEAVGVYLMSQVNVNGAWLVLMEKDGEKSFLIVVDFIGDRQATFNGIASVAVPKLREGELIDMVSADSDFGQKVIQGFSPFYRR